MCGGAEVAFVAEELGGDALIEDLGSSFFGEELGGAAEAAGGSEAFGGAAGDFLGGAGEALGGFGYGADLGFSGGLSPQFAAEGMLNGPLGLSSAPGLGADQYMSSLSQGFGEGVEAGTRGLTGSNAINLAEGAATTDAAPAAAGTLSNTASPYTPGLNAGPGAAYTMGSGTGAGAVPGLNATGYDLSTLGVPSGIESSFSMPSLSGILSGAKEYAPLASLASGISGLSRANQLAKQAAALGKRADPWGQSGGRGVADAQLQGLLKDPNAIYGMPGYQAGLDAVQRKMASQGYLGSGNMMAALQQYGGDFYNNAVKNLGGLSGANTNPGTGAEIELLGTKSANDLASQSMASLGYGMMGNPLLTQSNRPWWAS